MPETWFSTLESVHQVRGRGRWRYRCAKGVSTEAGNIAQAVENLAGVMQVRVNAKASSLIVSYDPAQIDAFQLEEALGRMPAPARTPRAGRDTLPQAPTAVVGALATLIGTQYLPQQLKLPATLAASLPLMQHATKDALANGLSSHVLEAAAVAISMARKDYLAANTTTFMLALGEYLEDSIARRSDEMLKHLLLPVGPEVWVEREGGEQLVAVSEVSVGDTVIVATGSIVPVDGTVLSGEGSVNEAAMTGESAPVTKQRGDSVLSGTLMEEGRLRIYAEQVGRKTAAARIADYVEQSLNVKSTAQLEAAKLADRLVPIVLSLAGTAWLVSGDWQRAAAVLQADYSCALKLATPVAFKSAMYGAGQQGILVKGATALERLAEADTFVFDKTGTLTTGSLAVTDSIAFDEAFSSEELIWLAASVEEHYFHPLAQAVVAAARSSQGRHFDHTEVEFVVAHGVASEIEGKRIVVGSRHFIEDDEGISVSQHEAVLAGLYREGKTLLYIGFGGRLIGVLALKDSLRANSRATVERLRALGARRVLMLTGDHHDRAAELATELGLEGFHAELLPDDKASLIAALAADGARIAFIGDGINDAPALAGAHVGIAMQRGADIARVADAKALALATMGRIDTNYRLAVGLNTAILGAASFGLLSPIMTSALHNGSTIAILLNALRRSPPST
ncbi:MAG: heavy metal translocating P-type ATPase [Candidatus Dactylopiibacterium carminicum]|uniref:P-type Zn(2+) transporter n=1 Tax=Candidatus Dactylopiibacterium carminicum TaxID=857335 RepID=A0A272EP30_9RHOO|nr:heavy metal translocating P-type ATPase [Candidatus Dactylopiibacterium carminicum]KAF7598223.1 heavy metal translocating P-type ATPase [Candidatus Dactylopiibacterium carminicum]PAS91874.1 MAG: heavy metal translocating P-type ATPase [Candidatus Dactylopiibacterium carminicum]PAS97017.1 MAG: ATPase [Candidatus Dactylopiibacterium carminicum]